MYFKSGGIFIILLILFPTLVVDGRCIRYSIRYRGDKKYFVYNNKWFDDLEAMKDYAFEYGEEPATRKTIATTTLKPSKRIKINVEKLNQNFLKQTNKFRKMHKAKPLTFSPEAAKAAQAYAEECAKKNRAEFDYDEAYNTNLDGFSVNEYKNAIKIWYEEEKVHNYNDDTFMRRSRHFSLMVWQTLKEMGCGIAQGAQEVFVVCKYGPYTLLQHGYKKNVLKKN